LPIERGKKFLETESLPWPLPFALSLQDLAPIAEGTSTAEAMAETILLAQEADRLGYTRLWYAEHHGMPSIASSVPEILIGSAASHTRNIRVGSGGVMLLNHAPLRIAEAYRTLEALHPGRIDLGLGRAPGGDGYAMRALRSGGGEEFSAYLAELMAFDEDGFPPDHPFSRVPVSPRRHPPAAHVAARLLRRQRPGGRPIGALATPLLPISATRPPPRPSRPIATASRPATRSPSREPCSASRSSARPLTKKPSTCRGSQAVSWALFTTGEQRKLMSPEEAHARVLTAQQQAVIDHQSPLWIIGSPETVRAAIAEKAESCDADEVMITTTIHSYELRRRSYALVAEAFGLEPRS
jgi:alkanesulfonate monooxygenase SsuD/methylene tetrahydromethanopterin reductase-like flavin-dependent oxidoreductase (luciferase family)